MSSRIIRAASQAVNRLTSAAATRMLLDASSAIKYQVSAAGSRSRERLEELQDRFAGERCVVVGNGPSLRRMDLASLKEQHTFCLNRGHLLFDKLGFPPTFSVVVNSHVISQSASEILRQPSTTFVSWQSRRILRPEADVIYIRTVWAPHFSTDPTRGVWSGGTVTFVAMQLAYFMGFRQVVLIGVDHSFSTVGPPNQLVTSSGDDVNHFDPNYFGAGYRWQLPDLETSEVAYEMARQHFDRDGREIIDATLGGKLRVFRKASYTDVITGRSH